MTAAASTAPNSPQLQGANFLNLLVVDDERSIRDVCREVAQSLGFNTSVAESAEHAYRQLDAQTIVGESFYPPQAENCQSHTARADQVATGIWQYGGSLAGDGEAVPDHCQSRAEQSSSINSG